MPGRLGGISRLRVGSGLRSVEVDLSMGGAAEGRGRTCEWTYVLVDEEDGDVAPLGVLGERGFDSRDGCF